MPLVLILLEFIKNVLVSGSPSDLVKETTTLTISNKEMKDTKKLVKFLKEFDLLIKYVSETIKNEIKGQKGGFFSILLSTLDGDLLRSLLSGKE